MDAPHTEPQPSTYYFEDTVRVQYVFFNCKGMIYNCMEGKPLPPNHVKDDESDKVRMYEETMTNDDNLESCLLTSSLLKIHSLYKFCRVLLQVAHVELEI